MRIGKCDGCETWKALYEQARSERDEAVKTTLSVLNPYAYSQRYPRERKEAQTNVTLPPITPEELRAQVYTPELSADELEAQFEAL